MFRFVLLILVLLFHSIKALQLSSRNTPTRRRAVIESIFIGTASSAFVYQPLLPAYAEDDHKYENRDRNKNKDALIREDYWYFSGRRPPRRLDIDAFPADDPTWNTWG